MTLSYSTFPAVLAAIDFIGQGQLETRACDSAGISVVTFRSVVRGNVHLEEMLEEAEARGYDALADGLVSVDVGDPANPVMLGFSNPAMARLLSDNTKWLLERRRPKLYGQKVEVKHEHTLDRAVIDALNAAKQRRPALPSPSAEVIDATYTRVDP